MAYGQKYLHGSLTFCFKRKDIYVKWFSVILTIDNTKYMVFNVTLHYL